MRRLPFIWQVALLWRGPISLAIYMPFRQTDARGMLCRARVRDYLEVHPGVNLGHPFAVSLLYATGQVPTLSCELNDTSTGFETPTTDPRAFEERFGADPGWQVLWDAEYPVNALRTLARNVVRVRELRTAHSPFGRIVKHVCVLLQACHAGCGPAVHHETVGDVSDPAQALAR
jgi:hypothetical protein